MLYDEIFVKFKSIFTRKRILQFLGIFLILIFGYIVANYSWLEVNINNSEGSPVTVTATRQSDLKQQISTSKSSKYSLFTKKGSYEVTVRSGESSYYTLVKVNGFFTTAKKTGTLHKENEREYVGNNPFYCMSDIDSLLISYNCEGNFNSATLHLPSTTSAPTRTEPDAKAPNGAFGGIVSYKNQHILLINSKDSAVADGGYNQLSHTLYQITITNGRPVYTVINSLSGLSTEFEYSLSIYGDKLGLFSKLDPSKLYTLDDVTSQPALFTIPANKKEESLYNSNISNGFVVNLYATPKGIEKRNFSRAVVFSKDSTFDYTFKHYYESGFVCGKLLCMKDGSRMDIYRLTSKKVLLQYRLVTAWQAIPTEAGLLFSTEKGDVIVFNTDAEEGYSIYKIGTFALVSITENSKDEYLLSLTNSHFDNFVLRLTNTPDSTDEIDKKVDIIRGMDSVASVSIQGTYIYIVPNRGEVVYDESTKNFDYDPQVTRQINTEIDNKILELKIDTARYHIINTGK